MGDFAYISHNNFLSRIWRLSLTRDYRTILSGVIILILTLLPSTQFDTQTISTRERLSPTNNTSAESIDCENCCQPCGDLCSRVIRSVRSGCSRVEQDLDPWNVLVHLFPVFQWLPRYQWASDFVYDLTAGITVAVMQIPQGMSSCVEAYLRENIPCSM